MKRQRNAPDELEHYIDLLMSAYENRMKHRTNTLSHWSITGVFKVQQLQTTQTTQFLLKKRQIMFFEIWAPKALGSLKINEFCTNPSAFKLEYKSLLQQFQSFLEGLKVSISKDQYVPMVYGALTRSVTVTIFRDGDPSLIQKDERITQMIEQNKESLYHRNAQSFLQPFLDTPKLMNLSAEHLKRAFSEETPIAIAKWIDRALSAMINLLSFQGHREIGADHWLPVTLVLFIYVNPPRIASVMQYMHNFLLTLSDGNPVSQSQEYNVTMAHSAASYFINELQQWEIDKGLNHD